MKNRTCEKVLDHAFNRPNPMLTTTQINQIVALHRQGKSIRNICKLVSVSRNTVRKYLRPVPVAERGDAICHALVNNREEIRSMFLECHGHCVPLLCKVQDELDIQVHLRTLQRFCKPFREEIKQTTKQTRYETAPAVQMQIDFGEKDVVIAGVICRVHFFVSILSFSRRIFVKAYPVENQAAWLDGLESAFGYFGGVPFTVLSDNSRCLVTEHRRNESARLTTRYDYFSQYWRFTPVVATPYYPQCKGKVERAVRYVKENALEGKTFEDMSMLNDWLEEWCLGHSDERVLDAFIDGLRTPKERFKLERNNLQKIDKPRAFAVREESRRVDNMGLIRVDNQYYRVPDAVKNMSVQTLITDNVIVVFNGGLFVAELDKAREVYHPEPQPGEPLKALPELPETIDPRYVNTMQRSLEVYSQLVGGNWYEP